MESSKKNEIIINLLNNDNKITIEVDKDKDIIDTINNKLKISEEDAITKQPRIFLGNEEIFHSETFSDMGIDDGARLTIKYPEPESDFPFNSVALDARFNQVEPTIDTEVLLSFFREWHNKKLELIEEANEPGIPDRKDYLRHLLNARWKLNDYSKIANHGVNKMLDYMVENGSKYLRKSRRGGYSKKKKIKKHKTTKIKLKKSNIDGGVNFSDVISKTNIGKKQRDLDNISMTPEENPSKTLADNDMWFNHCVKEVFSKYNIWSKEDLTNFNKNPENWLKSLGLELDEEQFEEMMAYIELCSTNENEHFLDYEVKSKRKTKKKPNSSKSAKPWKKEGNITIPNIL